jgi:hypothetical protein
LDAVRHTALHFGDVGGEFSVGDGNGRLPLFLRSDEGAVDEAINSEITGTVRRIRETWLECGHAHFLLNVGFKNWVAVDNGGNTVKNNRSSLLRGKRQRKEQAYRREQQDCAVLKDGPDC